MLKLIKTNKLNINYKTLVSVALLILAIFTFASNTKAQSVPEESFYSPQMIRVSPIILNLTLKPGSVQNFTIKVENLLDNSLPVKSSVEGFDADDEDYGISAKSTSNPSPLVNWIKLSDYDTIIPAKSSKDFAVEVQIPSQVNLGGYYAVIFFNPFLPSNSLQISSRVGVIALANIGVSDVQTNQAKVETFQFDKLIYESSPVNTTIRVKNNSLNYFTVKPTLTLKPLFGSLKTYELEEKVILPGKIRRWQKSLELNNLPIGIYLAKLSASIGNGEQIIENKNIFFFPVKIVALSIVIFIMVLYALIYRSRVVKAWKLLIKGK